MSAGHRHHHVHSAALLRELRRLLAEKRVIEYLDRPYDVDFSHETPLTGGSSVDGKVYFLDPRLKRRYRVGNHPKQELWRFVLRHERVEKAFRAILGMAYARAHDLATAAERLAVEAAGLNWRAYLGIMESIVRRDEHERPKSLPKGYDYGPLRAIHGVKALARLRRAA